MQSYRDAVQPLACGTAAEHDAESGAGVVAHARRTSGMSAMRGRTCGVDEAGRGPLAGPVYAAAVILPARHRIDGLADSKTLTAAKREALACDIKSRALAWAVASASVAEIDSLNILRASLLAMRRAVE